MKKLLFATTALIATAGMAAAEIKFSGYGRFGIAYKEDRMKTTKKQIVKLNDAIEIDPRTGEIEVLARDDEGEFTDDNEVVVKNIEVDIDDEAEVETKETKEEADETILVSRLRINIDASAETESGVKFGSRVRLQADENNETGEAQEAKLNGANFYVEYGGLQVVVGNVAGAFDNLSGYYGSEPGLENFIGQYSGVDYSFLAYATGKPGANAAFFNYELGDFAFAASYDPDGDKDNDRWDMSATYAFGNVTAAVAHGQNDMDESLTVLTLAGKWGDFSGTLFVADDDVSKEADNGTAYGVSAAYKVGAATTLNFAYGDGSADNDKQQYGVGAIYDLGGGASLRGGIGQSKVGDKDGILQADFGAQFNF